MKSYLTKMISQGRTFFPRIDYDGSVKVSDDGCGCCQNNVSPDDFDSYAEAVEFVDQLKDRISAQLDAFIKTAEAYFMTKKTK